MGYLFSLNEYGDSLWCYRYKGYHDYDDTQFNEVIPTDDGGYMAVGYTLPYYPPNNTAAFLVKTDSIGMSPGVIPLNTREYAKSSNRINVFPNPAKDFISFSMENNGSRGECRVEIFDAQGKKVLETKRLPEANKISISKLNTGIYLFKLHNHSGTYTGQFLKK